MNQTLGEHKLNGLRNLYFWELQVYSVINFNCWNFHGIRLQQSF